MNRRSSVKALAAGGLVAAFGSGYYWLTKDRDHADLALDLVIDRLRSLEPNAVVTTGAWPVARTFAHLAQSVEFCVDGFPEMKSALFQNTAGRLAFSVFQANGRMMHGLDEPIPGEVINEDSSDPVQSQRRLIAALERFQSFDGPLMPHFAYGELTRDEYAIAHALHVNNHFEEMRFS